MGSLVKVRGFSLIEMLVTLAIMSIGMVVMAGYMSYVTNQQRILMQNAEAVSVDNNITNLMTTNNQYCSGNILKAGIAFPSGNPPANPFNVACANKPYGPGGCPLQALYYFDSNGNPTQPAIAMGPQNDGTGLNISTVQLRNIKPVPATTGAYSADLVITYSGNPAPGAFTVPLNLGASTAKGKDTLQSCVSQQTTCASGYTFVGSTGTTGGDQLCISTTAQPAADFGHATAVCGSSGGLAAHVCSPAEWEEACVWDPGPGSVSTQGPQTNASTCQCSKYKVKMCWSKMGPSPCGTTCASWTDPSTGASCTPTYQIVLASAHDNGPKLHMGSPPEWVNLEHLYDNGNGGQWNGTIMGGPGPNMNDAGQCVGWGQYQTYLTNSYPYRCCYRP